MDKVKVFTGSGSFDIRDEMINDSKDFLDTVEVTTIAQECVNLKQKEDEIAELEDKLKKKKEEAEDEYDVRRTKRRGRRMTILTSQTGAGGNLVLGKPTLLGT